MPTLVTLTPLGSLVRVRTYGPGGRLWLEMDVSEGDVGLWVRERFR